MDTNDRWLEKGHIDRVFDYDKKQKFDKSGQKYEWIQRKYDQLHVVARWGASDYVNTVGVLT